jgi:hypothetical protein
VAHSIKIPKDLNYLSVSQFTLELKHLSEVDILTIDFSDLKYSRPLAMLMLGTSIRQIVISRKIKGLRTACFGINNKIAAHSYLDHVGFFDFMGLSNKNKIGAAQGNDSYIPIRCIKREQFETKGRDSKRIRDEILTYSNDLAQILAGQFEDYEAKRTLAYAFKETIRNVFEHAEAHFCFLAGQRWADGTVEVAVIDEGRGILASLSETYSIANDGDALLEAIKPGVSRMAGKEPNENENSGFGLYVLSEIGKNFGRFILGSGNSALRMTAENPSKRDEISHKGTFVGLRLQSVPNNFAQVLDEIVLAGENTIGENGKPRKASPSSKEF